MRIARPVHGDSNLHADNVATGQAGTRWLRAARTTRLRLLRRRLRAARGAAGFLAASFLALPVVRHVRCIQLRRLRPLRNGQQHGTPIVRHYWAEYLEQHRDDIRGRCLEIGTSVTLRKYGGPSLSAADAMDLTAHSPEVTVVGDLSRADHVPADSYDCFVNQFTMHVIYDVEAALYHSIRILKPGGVLLVNFPCVDYYFPTGLDMKTGGLLFMHHWFTPIQVEDLLHRVGLAERDYNMSVFGNLFARVAYQMNMPAAQLTRSELAYRDPGHPLLICARAVKPADWCVATPVYREPWQPEVAPAQWSPTTGHYAR